MTSDRAPEEALYIALCGKKVLKLPCFGSVFRVDILISQQVYDEESVLKQLLGLKGRYIQADAKIRIIPRLLKAS